MELKVLYDNDAQDEYRKGWGFSCLVKLKDGNTLFDTGWDGEVLLSNMERMGERPKDIRRIVLSHSHWDHIGGLNHLRTEKAELWVPQSFSEHLKAELASRFVLREVAGPQAIGRGIWTTGELGATVKEQSLVLETSKGVLVVVGCSHPGVPAILDAASQFGRPWGILGGMHGFQEYRVLEGLGLIVPTHCTVHKREILDRYPKVAVEGRVGMQIGIDE